MSGPATGENTEWQRLDKWLWYARFLRHRADCALLAQDGLVRVNRQPTDKAHARLRVGDMLTLPLRQTALVIEVLALGARRGPASEARGLYREIAPPEPRPGVGVRGTEACDAAPDAAYPPPRPVPPIARSAR